MRRPTRPARKRMARRRKLRIARTPGYSNRIYTYDFRMASQTIRSGIGGDETPIVLNSGVGTGVFRPLVPPTAPSTAYGENFFLASSTLGLPNYYDLGIATSFRFNQVANFLNWENMYDQYRFNYVKIEIENCFPAVAGAIARPQSDLYLATDFNSVGVPQVISSVTGRQGVKMVSFNDSKTKTTYIIKPKPVLIMEGFSDVGNPGTITQNYGGMGKTGQWLNMGDPDTQFYGFKAWLTNWLVTGTQAQMSGLRFTMTFNVSFKQPETAY